METAIELRNLSKTYRLKRASSRDGESGEVFHALDQISFSIAQGECVGIVGANGSGKSTLLKILSHVTEPSAGEAEINGSVASVLEIGMGFHPELSGRENIFLSGALLGLSKKEIRACYPQIVEFSGIAEYIDAPVKVYSSGMYVRLAFSVISHLKAGIMLFDEVLSVGDLEFQGRCLARIRELIGEGRTILFVSHNLQDVVKICPRTLLLSNGKLIADGPTEEIIQKYTRETYIPPHHAKDLKDTGLYMLEQPFSNDFLSVHLAGVRPSDGQFNDPIRMGEAAEVEFSYTSRDPEAYVIPGFSVYYLNQTILSRHYASEMPGLDRLSALKGCGKFQFRARLDANVFNDKEYILNVFFIRYREGEKPQQIQVCNLFFKVEKARSFFWERLARPSEAVVYPRVDWHFELVNDHQDASS